MYEFHHLDEKYFFYHLRQEMEEIESIPLTTKNGNTVTFKFVLFPSDMKWELRMAGELNNAALFF